MAKPLTQEQLDAIWKRIDAEPGRSSVDIAREVGLGQATVRNVRFHGRRVAAEPYSVETAIHLPPKVKPKHVRSEMCSADWWAENDQGSRRLLARLAREQAQEAAE
jgi:hypothetical protein